MNYKVILFLLLMLVLGCKTNQDLERVNPVTPDIGAVVGEKKFGKMMRGIPDVLLPNKTTNSKTIIKETYKIINSGERNLIERPFDYRSPFTLKDPSSDIYEYERAKSREIDWTIKDDLDKPFNYYLNDKVAIGLMGGPENATVDAFGTMRGYTGAYGFAQANGSYFDMRIRTLENGYLPIVNSVVKKDGFDYKFEYFGAEIKDAPTVAYPRSKANFGIENVSGRNVFLSISCDITNVGNEKRIGSLLLGYDERSMLPAGAVYSSPDYNGAWSKIRLEKKNNGAYRLLGERDNIEYTLAIVNTTMELQTTSNLITHWPLLENPKVSSSIKFPADPAALTLSCEQSLEKGASAKVSLLIPMFPLKSKEDNFLLEQSAFKLKASAKEIWLNRKTELAQFIIPEEKVENTLYTALNNLDICAVFNKSAKYPTPGPSAGHHIFYGRDSGDMIYAYDLMGDHKTAAEMLNMYRGLRGGPESLGIYIWALERHYAITRDKQWLKDNFDIIETCMNTLIEKWEKSKDENDGLYPVTKLHDNEYIKDRFIGTHLYAASSAKRGYLLADVLGKSELSSKWKAFYITFSDAVQKNLELTAQKTGGVITPGFSGFDAPSNDENMPFAHYGHGGGCDWHNLGALYPTAFFEPNNKLNQTSYDRWRHCYVEGLFPYARRQGNYSHLHGYNGMNLSESFLRDGMYAEALRDLYGILLHTSSSNAAAEQIVSQSRADMATTPMGTSPHNWFSGKVISLIRDMIVYEEENQGELHLLSGMSPEWMVAGKKIEMNNVPTTLGTISMLASMSKKGMELDLDFKPFPEAKRIMVDLPPFVEVSSFIIDGKKIESSSQNSWSLPIETKKVTIEWSDTTLPNISYKEVVKSYVNDYEKRVLSFKQTKKF